MRIEEHEIFKQAATISNPNPVMIPMPPAIPSDNSFGMKPEENSNDKGFKINAVPAAIIGAIIGMAIGRNHDQNRPMVRIEAPKASQTRRAPNGFGQNNYYNQMKHLSDNLRVIFTPVSAVYMVKDGVGEVPLETIEVEEMNDDMLQAWKNRDHAYYKNLLLNKMHSEIQYAEKAFAKQILERQMGLNKAINKDASENFDSSDLEDMTDIELYHYASLTSDFFSKETPLTEKVATFIIDSMDDGNEYVIAEAKLDRPFDKYAGAVSDFANALPFGKKDAVSSDQGRFLNPSYLKNNVKVGFFPDRLIFIVDSQLISTLPVIAMNEEGFEHFQKKDVEFFKKFFHHEVRRGIAKLNDKFPEMAPRQEKTAALDKLTAENIFSQTDIHPVVYFLFLLAKYGYEWVDFDANALIAIIEKDFALTRPIGDIALNKIMSVKIANNGDVVYTSRHAFEKVVRAFNDKPVDFFSRETDDLDLADLVFALDVLERVTPYDNIYDNFSPEVYDYMVKVLASKENYVWGVSVSGSDEESQFITILNYSLLAELTKRFIASISNDDEIGDIIDENELIFDTILKLINEVHTQLSKMPETDIGDFLRNILKNSDIDSNIAEVIIRQVIKNVVIDFSLEKKEQRLMAQLIDLKLHNQ